MLLPCHGVVWDWYVNQSRRELHPNAWKVSTALPLWRAGRKGVVGKFESRGSVIGNVKERGDLVVELALGGAQCRLYVPGAHRKLFYFDTDRNLRLRRPQSGQAPFPVLMPSSGRSAVDAEPGFKTRSSCLAVI